MKYFMAGLCSICLVILIIIRIVAFYSFSIGCAGHLKRAADANTIELAKVELRTAMAYLETHNLTSGYCSIFLKQPKNDIGFFYSNLKASMQELEEVLPTSTQLERSNMLMKLRETLLDSNSNGTVITCPGGISIYPHNASFFWGVLLLSIVGTIAIYAIVV